MESWVRILWSTTGLRGNLPNLTKIIWAGGLSASPFPPTKKPRKKKNPKMLPPRRPRVRLFSGRWWTSFPIPPVFSSLSRWSLFARFFAGALARLRRICARSSGGISCGPSVSSFWGTNFQKYLWSNFVGWKHFADRFQFFTQVRFPPPTFVLFYQKLKLWVVGIEPAWKVSNATLQPRHSTTKKWLIFIIFFIWVGALCKSVPSQSFSCGSYKPPTWNVSTPLFAVPAVFRSRFGFRPSDNA